MSNTINCLNINELAAGFFSRQLYAGTSEAETALAYLRKRGMTDALISKYRLGYCPAKPYDTFTQYALKHNYPLEDLRHLGLTQYSRLTLKLYDRFYGRIMLSKWNGAGQLVGFGGRITGPQTHFEAKYIQSAQTEIYDMKKIVYGLHWAAESVVSQGWALVVEGYMDVISLREAGILNVVSPIGIFLTQDHLNHIKNYTNRLVIMLDGDRAGKDATIRLMPQLLKEGWEAVAVTLPGGDDPDSFLATAGVQAFNDLLEMNVPEHWVK